ncbi:ARM repeat-containing protein [Rickenella mellea]|uniref:ARM repeat-containing protein n=1 Tax=Rickenella mellea TaxID=50990 RepID=A0A4Y7Q631_9AGAM|nr:ARM repeat-containing protein [Rickenella mellea]
MPAKTSSLVSLPEVLPKIFEQAQVSTANHKKNFVALSKLQLDAALHTESTDDGKSLQLTGEKIFEDLFIGMVTRLLTVKKGTVVVERVVKFIAGYITFIHDKDANKQLTDNGDEEDSLSLRFVTRFIKFLLKGFEAKDKNVRFRVVQIIAEIIPNLDEVDDEIFQPLHEALTERAEDKEPLVRMHAVIALAKLLVAADEEGARETTDLLVDILKFDPSPEVRRAALINIPASEATLPALLSRTRDVDTTIRKLVYSNVLEQLGHPKQLTIAQRELVLHNGLGDREPAVRSAASNLVASWVDHIGDLVAFLKSLDLAESKVVEDALQSVFESRPDIFDGVEFGDDFWRELTPERAFLARVFVDHCINSKNDARLESSLPVVTALAFHIQSTYNNLVNQIEANLETRLFEGEDESDKETDLADMEFVMGELLKLAVNLDYADEIGRRKMFALVKDMISHDILPDTLLSLCLDVLRILSPSERDLIRVVVEVIHDLRDPGEVESDERPDGGDGVEETPMPATTPARPPKPPAEMSPQERERADAIDLRCLSLCIGMLERVNSSFEENSTLEGILGELILPSVQRKEPSLREKGLVSLGLCCLIARGMARRSFKLFANQTQGSQGPIKLRVLQILIDNYMVHESQIFVDPADDKLINFLAEALHTEESAKVQAVLGTGLAKLMLSGMVSHDKVLTSLFMAYVSPDTASNLELRQCLSYFFPVYCYSSSANQRRLQKIFLPTYEQLAKMHSELDEDEEMVKPSQIAMLLADWTDPQKTIKVNNQEVDQTIHVDLAIDILKALFNKDMTKDDKKVMCQLLGKLYIPDDVDIDKIRSLKLLVNNIQSRRPLRDATSKNAFARFDGSLAKRFAAQLEGFNEEDFRKLEDLKELFEFLDDIIPLDDDDEIDVVPAKGRKRRSESVATTTTATTADEDDYGGTPEPPSRSSRKTPAKRRRVSKSDDDNDSLDNTDTSPPPPPRSVPRRAAATRKPIVDAVPDSEEDEEDEDDDVPPSKSRYKSR